VFFGAESNFTKKFLKDKEGGTEKEAEEESVVGEEVGKEERTDKVSRFDFYKQNVAEEYPELITGYNPNTNPIYPADFSPGSNRCIHLHRRGRNHRACEGRKGDRSDSVVGLVKEEKGIDLTPLWGL